MNKEELLAAIEDEIEDRGTQATESGEPEKYSDERKALAELLELVALEKPLSYSQYEWLSYLCANSREAKLREELE